MAEQKKTEKNDRYTLAEIATQTDIVIVDNQTKEHHTVLTFLAKIGNEFEQIKKILK